MSLTQKLAAPPFRPVASGPRCHVGKALALMSEKDHAAVVQAMEPNSGFSAAFIAKALREDGYPVSTSSALRHRRGECSCGSL